MSGVVAFVLLYACLIIASIMGFMETTVGLWVSITVSLLLSWLVGHFTYKLVWLAIALLGIIAGIFFGVMVYSIVLSAFKLQFIWLMGLCAITFACLGGWLSARYSRDVVLVGTSLIGAYSFMRGFSYFFGGYPNEAKLLSDLKNEIPLDDMNDAFWVYLAIFILGTIVGIYYQYNHVDDHEQLKQHKQYSEAPDNFTRVKSGKIDKKE